MSTGLTLFGGLAAVLIIYGLARVMRVSIELAGLIAAGIPLGVYIASMFVQWPGLDVFAIHIAVYIIAAFVLVVFSRYRVRQARMHWAPKALIGFFLVLVVMNAGFLYVATDGLPPWLARVVLPGYGQGALHTGFSGTTRHGQEAAKAVGSDLSRQHRNNQMGWEIRVEGLLNPRQGPNGVMILAEDGNGKSLSGLNGELRVARPGATDAAVYPLHAVGPGEYEGRPEFDGPGLWLVELRIGAYRQNWDVQVGKEQP